jgi:hypothetical protein
MTMPDARIDIDELRSMLAAIDALYKDSGALYSFCRQMWLDDDMKGTPILKLCDQAREAHYQAERFRTLHPEVRHG